MPASFQMILSWPPARFEERARYWTPRQRQLIRDKLVSHIKIVQNGMMREKYQYARYHRPVRSPGPALPVSHAEISNANEKLRILAELPRYRPIRKYGVGFQGDDLGRGRSGPQRYTKSHRVGIFGPDNGWFYKQDRKGNVQRAHKPSGRWWESVAASSRAGKAIKAAIAGGLPQLTKKEISELGLSNRTRRRFSDRDGSGLTNVLDVFTTAAKAYNQGRRPPPSASIPAPSDSFEDEGDSPDAGGSGAGGSGVPWGMIAVGSGIGVSLLLLAAAFSSSRRGGY